MSEPILALEGLRKRFGRTVTADDFSIDIGRGEFFTLLGPSGSGKSTILRLIAGLERPDAGVIRIEGQDVTASPPWERRLGMVFQQYANFPHMNVRKNVGYGLRRSTLSAAERAARVDELLELVGLGGFGPRSVTTLSGGEQQRVAIARALAPRPAILLLDEPLSALDEKIRREMQDELRAIQRGTGTTFVYVTHDQEEALTMSDRVALLNLGRPVQCDAPEALFRRPRTPFVARFFRGCNVLHAPLPGYPGVADTVAPGGTDGNAAGPDTVAVRAEAVRLGDEAEGGAFDSLATIEDVAYLGLYTRYRLRLEDGQTLNATRTVPIDAVPGTTIRVGARREDVIALEPDEA